MTKLRFFGLALALTSVGLVGCGDDDRVGDDAGPDTSGIDVGPRPDGSVDGGPDTGTTPDAGMDTGGGTRGSMCPMTPCNPVTAAGCAAGEACYFASMEEGAPAAPLCAPAGVGAMGAACTNVNDCQENFTCIRSGSAAGGTCQPLCCAGQNSDCPVGGSCSISFRDEGTVMACAFPDGCDLLAQTGCMAEESCFPMSADGATSCSMAGSVADGATCTFSNDCAARSACLGPAAGPSICRRLCAVAMEGADCMGEETCSPLPGFDGVGSCVPPA